MKKFLITSLITFSLTLCAIADTDGENKLTKKKSTDVKDCFEKFNRGSFALNQGLDKIIFKPVAKAYRVLPSSVRSGTSNALVNLSSLITIPNNILQGNFKTAGVNAGRFVINTTVGVLGIFNVAKKIGFSEYILGGDPYYNASTHGNNEYLTTSQYMTTKVLTGVDFRAKNLETIDNLEKNSLDFYASVKSLYQGNNRDSRVLRTNSTKLKIDRSPQDFIDLVEKHILIAQQV